jgi:hypothetical protein
MFWANVGERAPDGEWRPCLKPQVFMKASAWYLVSYDPRYIGRSKKSLSMAFISLPWIACCNPLCELFHRRCGSQLVMDVDGLRTAFDLGKENSNDIPTNDFARKSIAFARPRTDRPGLGEGKS